MMHFISKKWLQVFFALMLCHSISCDCILPEIIFNGTVTIPNYYEKDGQDFVEELSVIEYTCSDDYIQIGPEFVQCFKGKWLHEAPLCLEEKCSNPPDVENATFVIENGDRGKPIIGSSAVYSCQEGYKLVNANASTLRCILNETSRKSSWKGEMPTCEENTQCLDPGISDHGQRSGNCCSRGDTLSFSCNEGYELVGDKEMHCLGNGNWSSGRPRCRHLNDYCEFPPPIPHGFLGGKKKGDYFVPGDEAEVFCEPGFKYEGNKFVQCAEGGNWTDDFKECKEIFCDPPEHIAYGTIPVLSKTNLTIFPYDFKIFYICDKGYRIFYGEIWRTCSENGWSGRTPRCQVVRCSDPGTPDNGNKIGTNYSVGASVRFECFSGYTFLGSKEISCNRNGQWVGEVARCNLPSNYCPDPGTPINGFKNMTEYKKGDRVRFRCQGGHILLGSEVRECLDNKTWSGTRTTCVGRYDFDSKKEIRDKVIACLAKIKERQRKELQKYQENLLNMESITYRSSASFLPGRTILYFAFDVSGSVTLSIFEKSIELAKAIVRKVGISKNGARAGAVAFSSKAEELFLPLIYDSTEDVLAALSRVNYTGGGTAINSALRWIRMESIPMVKQWLGDTEIKNYIFIFTDGKINMGGKPNREAALLKADGVEIFCIGITGDVKKKTLYDIASNSKYGDEIKPNVFIFQDYRKLGWLVDEIANDTANHSKCGLDMENINVNKSEIAAGNVSTEQWPWMAALYIGKGRQYIKCGGSIIQQQFILTAAHCFYDQNGRKRGANETTVKLGLKDLQDVTYLQQFKVRNIYEHEQYRNGTNMDYDIAVLELEKPITYNAFVRPICLPEKVMPENFYNPQTTAWAIVWDDAEVAPNQTHDNPVINQVLKDFRLIIQSRETCNETLRNGSSADNFMERVFCAGSVEGKNDTCVGDSGGGPVMQPRINDKGHLEWTQVGLVSCELGCCFKNEYGYYIRLQELMPWVHNTIEGVMKLMKK